MLPADTRSAPRQHQFYAIELCIVRSGRRYWIEFRFAGEGWHRLPERMSSFTVALFRVGRLRTAPGEWWARQRAKAEPSPLPLEGRLMAVGNRPSRKPDCVQR
jgi:hypothetical protein